MFDEHPRAAGAIEVLQNLGAEALGCGAVFAPA
jgi:hypothetical protein